jgi:hypothetical protein
MGQIVQAALKIAKTCKMYSVIAYNDCCFPSLAADGAWGHESLAQSVMA